MRERDEEGRRPEAGVDWRWDEECLNHGRMKITGMGGRRGEQIQALASAGQEADRHTRET